MTLHLTLGKGRRNARGARVGLAPGMPPAAALAQALEAQPSEVESWWSPHVWQGEHRGTERWESACGIAIDVDYHDDAGAHVPAPPEAADQIRAAAERGALPCGLFHLTPRGARAVVVFPEQLADRERYLSAARLAGAEMADTLRRLEIPGYAVDPAPLLDLARLLYSPRSVVDGVARDAALVLTGLPAEIPAAPVATNPPPVSFDEACRRYNAEHPGDWPRSDGTCPACGHRDCFGRFPDDETRWACFSSGHSEPGIKGRVCHHGDALDLDAHAAHRTRAEHLRAEGYLPNGAAPARRMVAVPAAEDVPTPGGEAPLTNSYASILRILRTDQRILKEPLEYDEMLCSPVIGGLPVVDATTGTLREQIELHCRDGKGRPIQPSAANVIQAIDQIAAERSFHPVREYLQALRWDGTERICAVAEDVIDAPEVTSLTQSLVRKWFISAVARPLRPGSKVDTVLILVGDQGAYKSTFFRTLAGDRWFADTSFDLQNKDAFLLLRKVWILEWAELETMARARDHSAIKSFISSQSDTFRPPFGRRQVEAERTCVIVGSTNDDDILSDPTGNRRYWPVRVGARVDVERLASWRDQLWAEAVTAYRAGEHWWLADAETRDLARAQEEFDRRDPWEDAILSYARGPRSAPLTTGEVLEKAVGKPCGQWTSADQRRVAAVLRTEGFQSVRTEGRASRRRAWIRGESESRGRLGLAQAAENVQ